MICMEIDIKALRELNRMMYTLYEFFSQSVSGFDNDKDSWDSLTEIERKVLPHEFFVFKNNEVSITIHELRDKTYTLDCRGIVPVDLVPITKNPSDYRYKCFYGRFYTLPDAVSSWSFLVRNYCNDVLGVFF